MLIRTSIRALRVTRNRTAQMQWKVVEQCIDGTTFSSANDLFTAIMTNSQAIQSSFTDATNLCAPKIRFVLSCANVSGTALESVWLVFTFQT